jgi:sarcosine oxidase subunit delta
VRPPDSSDDATWTQYLFERDNPAGLHLERWCHTYGCGQWFNAARNTLTHAILATYPIGADRFDASSEPK